MLNRFFQSASEPETLKELGQKDDGALNSQQGFLEGMSTQLMSQEEPETEFSEMFNSTQPYST